MLELSLQTEELKIAKISGRSIGIVEQTEGNSVRPERNEPTGKFKA